MSRLALWLAACFLASAGWCDPLLEARNAAVRAAAWAELTKSSDAAGLTIKAEEANARWLASLPHPTPSPADASDPVVAPAAPPPTERPRRRSAAGSDDRADVSEVVARARAARDAGQLEGALRLFRLASGMKGGESAAAEARRIEAEMGGQVDR